MAVNFKTIQNNLILFYIFILPWQTCLIWHEQFLGGKKWQYGTFVLFGSELILWLIIFLQIGILFSRRISLDWRGLKLKLLSKKGTAILSVWLFLFLSLLSVIWADNNSIAWYSFWHLLEAISFFFVIILNQIELKKIAWTFLMAGSVQSILAIGQSLFQKVSANKWLGIANHLPNDLGAIVIESGSERFLRAYGSFTHPNILAAFLLVTFLFSAWLFFSDQKKSKWFVFLLSIINLSALLLTFSRAAFIALLFSFIILGIKFFRSRTFKFLLLALILVLLSFSWLYWPLILSRVSGTQRLEAKSNEQRLESLGDARSIISQNIFFGIGIGNYTWASFLAKPNKTAIFHQPAHNLPILISAELGLIGIILSLFILYKIALVGFLQDSFLFCLIMAIVILSIFDHYFWTSYFGLMIFWLILALNFKSKEL